MSKVNTNITTSQIALFFRILVQCYVIVICIFFPLFSTSFNGKLVNGMLKRTAHSLLKPRRKTKLHQTGLKENIQFGFPMEGKVLCKYENIQRKLNLQIKCYPIWYNLQFRIPIFTEINFRVLFVLKKFYGEENRTLLSCYGIQICPNLVNQK